MRKIATWGFILVTSLAFAASPAVKRAHKSTHKIKVTAIGGGSGTCSATAIAPHAILTATHCEAPTDTIEVDGKEAGVAGTMGDGLDHTIILLKGIEFSDYAEIADNVKTVEQGDDIFLFGNPGDMEDMFRKGYVAGFKNETDDDEGGGIFGLLFGAPPKKKDDDDKSKPQPRVTLYDFNGFFGDSGSAMFNQKGEIVGVTSFITGEARGTYVTKYMGGYELRITKEQIKLARDWNPPKEGDDDVDELTIPKTSHSFIKKPN